MQWNWLVQGDYELEMNSPLSWNRSAQLHPFTLNIHPFTLKINSSGRCNFNRVGGSVALQAAEGSKNRKLFLTCLSTSMCSSVQASWGSLRTEFSLLSPAQLHHMLREYNPRRPCPSAWTPCSADADAACRTGEKCRQWHWYMIVRLLCSRRSQICCQTDTGKIKTFSADCDLKLQQCSLRLHCFCVITVNTQCTFFLSTSWYPWKLWWPPASCPAHRWLSDEL